MSDEKPAPPIRVADHVPLAVSIARRYGRGVGDSESVFEVALLALLRAAHGFDPERGHGAAYAFARVAPAARGEVARRLRGAVGRLSPREARIIRLQYGLEDDEGRTLEEIGVELGLSRGRVHRFEAMALRRPRRALSPRSSPTRAPRAR